MTEKEMFEKSFQRPWDYFKLSPETQWAIDKSLGILDWNGSDMSVEDMKRFKAHYKKPKAMKMPVAKKIKQPKNVKVVKAEGFRVRDLIAALKKCPQDRPVRYLDWQGGQTDVEIVKTSRCTFRKDKVVIELASKERMDA